MRSTSHDGSGRVWVFRRGEGVCLQRRRRRVLQVSRMKSGLHRLKLLSHFAAVSALRPMMMSTAGTAAASVSPPVAKRVAHTVTFGKVDGENRGTNPMEPVEIQDDLFWIRDDTRKNEEA